MGDSVQGRSISNTRLFRDVFDASPIGLAVENLEGQLLFVNPALCSFLGFSEEELCRKHCVDFSHPEDAEKDWTLFQQLRAGSIDHYQLEKRYFRRDGSLVWSSLTISLLKSRRSRLVLAMIEDITEKKKAEETLDESEERLRLAAQAGKMFAYSWDAATDVIERTGESAEILGVKSDQAATGMAVSAMVHPDDKQRLEAALSNLRVENPTLRITYRIIRPDGSVTWLERNSRAYFDAQGKVKRIVGMIADVTERKQAEEIQFRHTAIVESSDDAIASGTLDGIITTWNTGAQKLYEYTEVEAIGKSINMLVPPERRDEENKIIETLKAGGRIEQLETVRLSKTGKRINVSLSISPIRDSSGAIVGVAGIARDISDRKRHEQKLREYERAVESAEDMIGVIDREYRFLIANNQYLKMRNMTKEEVIGRAIPEVLEHKEIFETVLKPKLDECFQGKVVRYEAKFSYPALGERELSLSYFPIEGPNGIDQAVCILRDITDRKRAEEALVKLNRTLEAQSTLLQSSEELLRIFVKNVPVAVAMLDREMRYLQVSDRWCSDNAVEASELLGRSREVFPELPERWKEVNRRALRGETLRADEDSWESAGRTRWSRWEVRPWRKPDGTVGGILVFAEDITRRKQMEEELLGMSRKLIESQEQERSRIGRELHDDINQRLALLAIELEQLKVNPSEVKTRVEELRKKTIEISDDVQALSHELDSSKVAYLGVAAGMKSWCREFAERQRMEIDFKDSVQSVFPSEVGLPLFRILQEALHNASRHSGAKRVEVELEEDSGQIHLIISDLGKGFDLGQALQGKGLGLTSMQERVRLLNGTISIESEVMGGTKIKIQVPLEPRHPSQRAAG